MPIYEVLKKRLINRHGFLSQQDAAFAGTVGGLLAVVITNPIDVIKTNIMSSLNVEYINLRDCAKVLYREHGVKIFVSGMGFRLSYVLCLSLIFFPLYEYSLESFCPYLSKK